MKKARVGLLIGVVFMLMVSCSFTTANFSDLQMASEIDEDNNPVVPVDSFTVDSPVIYVTGTLNNAPEGTVIKAEWVYVEEEPPIYIDSVELEAVEITTSFNFNFTKPDNGWPVGKYEVRLYIDNEQEEIMTFHVE